MDTSRGHERDRSRATGLVPLVLSLPKNLCPYPYGIPVRPVHSGDLGDNPAEGWPEICQFRLYSAIA